MPHPRSTILLLLALLAVACGPPPETTAIYVNFDGVALTQAFDVDARRDVHYGPPCTVPPSRLGAASRERIVAQVARAYAPFDVRVVTRRPARGSYQMALVSGCPDVCGGWPRDARVGGCAGLDCGGAVANGIVHVFPQVYLDRCRAGVPPDGAVPLDPAAVDQIGAAVAHEVGHALGLDHSSVVAGCDLMSYGRCAAAKRFLDREVELARRPDGTFEDGCGPTRFNTYRTLLELLGPRPLRSATSP